jgi:hypothetical protein
VDGAYDTRKCHDAIAERGAAAVIPPRRNAKPWKAVTAGAVARNEALRALKYLGRALWRPLSAEHPSDAPAGQWMERIPPPEPRRDKISRDHAAHNPVSQRIHCVKLPGQRLMARDFDRQVAEFQVRVAVLNGYTALGIPVMKVVE